MITAYECENANTGEEVGGYVFAGHSSTVRALECVH